MTEDMSTSGIGLFGYIILFVIIVWVFGGAFGGGCGGFGWNRGFNNGCGFPGDGVASGFGFQNYKATCDAEKAQIINTATTQYQIEQQAAQTREVVTAQSNMLATKIDFYEYQNLRDAVAERDRKISQLESQMFTKDQLAPIVAQISDIRCNMLTRPNVTGVGVACPSAAILNGLGVNSLGCNNYNNGTLI